MESLSSSQEIRKSSCTPLSLGNFLSRLFLSSVRNGHTSLEVINMKDTPTHEKVRFGIYYDCIVSCSGPGVLSYHAPSLLIPGIYSHLLWNLLRMDMMYAHMCLGCSCMLSYAECFTWLPMKQLNHVQKTLQGVLSSSNKNFPSPCFESPLWFIPREKTSVGAPGINLKMAGFHITQEVELSLWVRL